MLYKNPELIAPETFLLIQQLQQLEELKGFYLVGGTSLTLQLGHRNSIDIDLFTQNSFESSELLDFLKTKYSLEERLNTKHTVIVFINKIKTDFIRHNYPFVKEPITEDGITFLSKEDIAAMKLNAISHSGKRLKDFIDIYFLLQHYSLNTMIDFFQVKYPQTNPLIPLKAINYFGDIDESIDPPKLLKPLPVNEMKKRIEDSTLHPYKVY